MVSPFEALKCLLSLFIESRKPKSVAEKVSIFLAAINILLKSGIPAPYLSLNPFLFFVCSLSLIEIAAALRILLITGILNSLFKLGFNFNNVEINPVIAGAANDVPSLPSLSLKLK
ncbi:hypothetical protein [Mycoplasma sp. 4423]